MTEIHSATPQLLALAAVMRPDWDPAALSGALVSAAVNGWAWPRAFLACARLLADPKGQPRDLLAEIADPVRRDSRPLSPADNARHAARARELLASGGAP